MCKMDGRKRETREDMKNGVRMEMKESERNVEEEDGWTNRKEKLII